MAERLCIQSLANYEQFVILKLAEKRHMAGLIRVMYESSGRIENFLR